MYLLNSQQKHTQKIRKAVERKKCSTRDRDEYLKVIDNTEGKNLTYVYSESPKI